MAINTPVREQREGQTNRPALTVRENAALIGRMRFRNKRPADLRKMVFSEDTPQANTDPARNEAQERGMEIRAALQRYFDRQEGKLDAQSVARLKEAFGISIDIWAKAGLFTDARKGKGYEPPDFERDCSPFLTQELLDMMAEGPGLDRGYKTVVWTPLDVSLYSENADTLNYFQLLKDALSEAFRGTAGGKEPETLLIGPEKRVLAARQVDFTAILVKWERYLKAGVVHDAKQLDPENHGGVSEEMLLAGLTGSEKRNGGTTRLERGRLIMPSDVGKQAMSGQDWVGALRDGTTLPKNVSAQNLKQAMAYVIFCLKTQGWIPDFYDYNDIRSSRIALVPGTYVPPKEGETHAGDLPALTWFVDGGPFRVGAYLADYRISACGMRGGVRIREDS